MATPINGNVSSGPGMCVADDIGPMCMAYEPMCLANDPDGNGTPRGNGAPDGTGGGAGSAGYEGGARGAGNATPSRPAEHPDDRCSHEAAETALTCAKLVRGFDVFHATNCVLELASLVSCLADRIEGSKPHP